MMKKARWIIWVCLVACLAALTGASAMAAGKGSIVYVANPVDSDRLNLRKAAKQDGEPVGRFYTGTAVEVTGTSGDYTKVKIGALQGYMQTQYLRADRAMWTPGQWGIVNVEKTGQKINLRAKPEKGAVVLDTFANGISVQILGESGDFYHVRTLAEDGYMQKDLIVLEGVGDRREVAPVVSGTIRSANVNLRAFPDKQAPAMQQLVKGTDVTIHATCGVWYYVEVRSDNPAAAQRGFVLGNMITPSSIHTMQALCVVDNPKESDRLHLRQGMGENTASLGSFFNGQQVLVLGQEGAWAHVQVGDKTGYMKREFLQLVVNGAEG